MGEQIIGKPHDFARAKQQLLAASGNSVTFLTSLTLLNSSTGVIRGSGTIDLGQTTTSVWNGTQWVTTAVTGSGTVGSPYQVSFTGATLSGGLRPSRATRLNGAGFMMVFSRRRTMHSHPTPAHTRPRAATLAAV